MRYCPAIVPFVVTTFHVVSSSTTRSTGAFIHIACAVLLSSIAALLVSVGLSAVAALIVLPTAIVIMSGIIFSFIRVHDEKKCVLIRKAWSERQARASARTMAKLLRVHKRRFHTRPHMRNKSNHGAIAATVTATK